MKYEFKPNLVPTPELRNYDIDFENLNKILDKIEKQITNRQRHPYDYSPKRSFSIKQQTKVENHEHFFFQSLYQNYDLFKSHFRKLYSDSIVPNYIQIRVYLDFIDSLDPSSSRSETTRSRIKIKHALEQYYKSLLNLQRFLKRNLTWISVLCNRLRMLSKKCDFLNRKAFAKFNKYVCENYFSNEVLLLDRIQIKCKNLYSTK